MTDLKAKKQEMDNEIREALTKIISKFNRETGLTPSSIEFQIIETTPVGNLKREYMVSSVTTEVKL